MSKILEAYIDETEIVVADTRCLIYGAAIPYDMAAALDGFAELKARFNVDPNLEVKWSSKGGDPVLKAALKEEAIALIGQHFQCVFVVWKSNDKDEAFLRIAELLRAQGARWGASYLHLLYDHDSFKNRNQIVSTLAAWSSPRCTLLADVESRLSLPMQFADLSLGAYSYLVRKQLRIIPGRTTVFQWEPAHTEEMPLDEVFRILLRHTIPGVTPTIHIDAEFRPEEACIKSCVDTGVIVDERFSQEERSAISSASTFYVGCMS